MATVRCVVCVLAAALCCTALCVAAAAAGEIPHGDAETPQFLLERVKQVAVDLKENTDRLKEGKEGATNGVAQVKAAVEAARKKALELREAAKVVDGEVGAQHASESRVTVVRLAREVADMSAEAIQALSAPEQQISRLSILASSMIRDVTTHKPIWEAPKLDDEQEASKDFAEAREHRDALTASLAKIVDGANAAVEAERSVEGCAQNASQKAETAIGRYFSRNGVQGVDLTKEDLLKTAEETVEMLEKALKAAVTINDNVTTAFKESDNASQSATLMVQLLDDALNPGKKRRKDTSTKLNDLPPEHLPTSEKQPIDSNGGMTPPSSGTGDPKALSDVPHPPKNELDELPVTTESSTIESIAEKTATSKLTTKDPNDADSSQETDAAGKNTPESNLPGAKSTSTNEAESSAAPSEKDKETQSMTSDANKTIRDIISADSSVSPPWLRTPLLLVVSVLGLLSVC
ncbi:hypothetical protein DQ04_14431010 [Trypanosoma grayi]|uniref:hypothetical protein n=1 Tax=Trypanosoma grayi TaxID=71804 RepID=UPI0004F4083F|nr:hypothetical protein DQ04_14431010 [Trypanosoma grayi]KEG06358.1 hypothetical protein DQ04_14431010 [Trypanosoma grayi]